MYRLPKETAPRLRVVAACEESGNSPWVLPTWQVVYDLGCEKKVGKGLCYLSLSRNKLAQVDEWRTYPPAAFESSSG